MSNGIPLDARNHSYWCDFVGDFPHFMGQIPIHQPDSSFLLLKASENIPHSE